jgi:hypothetical protein
MDPEDKQDPGPPLAGPPLAPEAPTTPAARAVPAAPSTPSTPALPPKPAAPFSAAELRGALLVWPRIVDYVLGGRERLSRNFTESRELPLLIALLFCSGLIFALPFGAVLDWRGMLRPAIFLMGSMMICFPSLHIFSQYFELKIGLQQNLVLAFTITATAAIFLFGFSPILWFIDYTIPDSLIYGLDRVTREMAAWMLYASLLLGVINMARGYLLNLEAVKQAGLTRVLILVWLALFIYITRRMGIVLELL